MTDIKTLHETILEADNGMVSATDRLKAKFKKAGYKDVIVSAHNHAEQGLWVVVGTAVK